MIVVNSKAGQRSNRLVTIAHALAAAIERNEDVWLTQFDSYKDDYLCKVGWNGRVIIRQSHVLELVRTGLSLLKRSGIQIEARHKIVFDWSFRDHESLKKHADLIRAFFQPKEIEAFRLRNKELLADRRIPLVGIHKRRRDYRDYRNGVYYYDDSVYDRQISRLQDEVDAKFVVFSDERPVRPAVEDQWLMSQCDYLVGPPSTFTMWASFMGKVPLGIIYHPLDLVSLKDIAYKGLLA